MSGRRNSVSDYPEHLNPFYEGGDKWLFWGKIKRSGSFSNSLKDLRNTITLRSFRGHKKPKYEKDDDVQLRNRTYNGYSTVSRQTAPAYPQAHIVTSTPLLPRSRFSERVRKSVDNSYDSSKNPFENGDDGEDGNEIKSEEYRRRVRRRKRRAPLPPGVKDSSWSLTSVETDISSYPHSEVSDLDVSEIEKPMVEICEMLQSFTKEMEKMTDSFNSNVENNDKSKELENDETHDRSKEEDISDNENIVCPKIVITSAESTPTKDNILIIESVSYTTEDEDYAIERKSIKEGEKFRNIEEKVEKNSHNPDSIIAENIVSGNEIIEEEPPPSSSNHEIIKEKSLSHYGQAVIEDRIVEKESPLSPNDHETNDDKLLSSKTDHNIIEENPSSLDCDQKKIVEKQCSFGYDHEKVVEKTSSSSCDHKIDEEKTSSLGCDYEKVEEKTSSLGCDYEKVEEKTSSSSCDHKIDEEKTSSLGCDYEKVEEKTSSLGCDYEKVEEKTSSSSCDHKIDEEKTSSSGCDNKIIVEEKVHNLDNSNHLNNNNSDGLGASHFSRYADDIKYIDESFTIYDRVMDDSDIRNDNSQKVDETNNNKENIPNGSFKENKFPVEENDFANGNGTNINKNVIEEKEIQEQPPVPKVRKKKFTKAKLLGFFSGK